MQSVRLYVCRQFMTIFIYLCVIVHALCSNEERQISRSQYTMGTMCVFFHFSVHGHSVKQKGIGFKIEILKIIHLSRLKKGNYRISTAFRCTQKNGVNVEVVRQQNNSNGFNPMSIKILQDVKDQKYRWSIKF